MTIQVYCDRDDIEAIEGEFGVSASIDDNQDGVESANEVLMITKAIQRAALKINACVRQQYKLIDVATNDWLIYANAVIALYMLRSRRGNPPEGSIVEEYTDVTRILHEIQWGRQQLPDQAPSFDYLPTVSSLQVQMSNPVSPVVVNVSQSTGSQPVGNRRRITAPTWSNFWN